MLKILYLEPTDPVTISATGAALRVLKADGSENSIPVRYLEGIVSAGRVSWESSALNLCLNHGVPITFRTRSGEPLGLLLPFSRPTGASESSRLATHLEQFVQLHGWPGHYRDWLTSEHRRAILHALKRLHLHSNDLRPQAVQSLLAAHLTRTLGIANMAPPLGHLEASLATLLARELAQFGVTAELLRKLHDRVPFLSDLVSVLRWQYYVDLVLLYGERNSAVSQPEHQPSPTGHSSRRDQRAGASEPQPIQPSYRPQPPPLDRLNEPRGAATLSAFLKKRDRHRIRSLLQRLNTWIAAGFQEHLFTRKRQGGRSMAQPTTQHASHPRLPSQTTATSGDRQEPRPLLTSNDHVPSGNSKE